MYQDELMCSVKETIMEILVRVLFPLLLGFCPGDMELAKVCSQAVLIRYDSCQQRPIFSCLGVVCAVFLDPQPVAFVQLPV